MAQVEEEEHWEDAKETMDPASSASASSASAAAASAAAASAAASGRVGDEADDDADGRLVEAEAEPEPVYTEEARKVSVGHSIPPRSMHPLAHAGSRWLALAHAAADG